MDNAPKDMAMDNRIPTEVERVAAIIKPNLFRLYPGGKSFAHEQARQTARAVLAALSTMDNRSPDGVTDEIERLRAALIRAGRAAGCLLADNVSTDFLMLVPAEIEAALLVSDRSGERMREDRDAFKVALDTILHNRSNATLSQIREYAGDVLAEQEAKALTPKGEVE